MISNDAFVLVSNKKNGTHETILNKYGFNVCSTAGDGHCILHAFSNSWTYQILSHTKPSMETILNGLFIECVNKRERYIPFTELSSTGFTLQMKTYLLQKHYSSAFCDLVPLMLSNIFNVQITILNNVNGTIHCHDIVPTCDYVKGHVHLLRSGDHYNGLRPSVAQRKSDGPPQKPKTPPVVTKNKFWVLSEEQSSFSLSSSYLHEFPSISESQMLDKQRGVIRGLGPMVQNVRKRKSHLNLAMPPFCTMIHQSPNV